MKSDSDHNSQSLITEDENLTARQHVNCPVGSSNNGGASPVESENSNLTASTSENITKPLSREPVSHSNLTCSPDTVNVPVPLPKISWPPVNEALTMDERLAHWDRYFKASPRSMTQYDIDVSRSVAGLPTSFQEWTRAVCLYHEPDAMTTFSACASCWLSERVYSSTRGADSRPRCAGEHRQFSSDRSWWGRFAFGVLLSWQLFYHAFLICCFSPVFISIARSNKPTIRSNLSFRFRPKRFCSARPSS